MPGGGIELFLSTEQRIYRLVDYPIQSQRRKRRRGYDSAEATPGVPGKEGYDTRSLTTTLSRL